MATPQGNIGNYTELKSLSHNENKPVNVKYTHPLSPKYEHLQ